MSEKQKPTDSLTPNQKDILVNVVAQGFTDISAMLQSAQDIDPLERDSAVFRRVAHAIDQNPVPSDFRFPLLMTAVAAGATRSGEYMQGSADQLGQLLDTFRLNAEAGSDARNAMDQVMARVQSLHGGRVQTAYAGQSDDRLASECVQTARSFMETVCSGQAPAGSEAVLVAGAFYAAQAAPTESGIVGVMQANLQPALESVYSN